MIPEFPEFKKIELSDKKEVEKITKQFPPYSDFNFVSMWSWNVSDEISISQLNGNLVVKFLHYITGEPFLSFIGLNKVNETAKELISASNNILGFGKEIKLIPEHVANNMDGNEFLISEEPDQFDYIYDLAYISEFKGKHFANKRAEINKLKIKCPSIRIKALDIADDITRSEIKKVNLAWIHHKTQKGDVDVASSNELNAIDRFLNIRPLENIITVGVFINDSIVGYEIVEQIGDENVICHYSKTDFSQMGINNFMTKEISKFLLDKGIKYLNFEQDLGIPGLKFSKERFSSGIYLKKYKVRV